LPSNLPGNPPPNQPLNPPPNIPPNPPPVINRGPSPYEAEEFRIGMQVDVGQGLFQQEQASTFQTQNRLFEFVDVDDSAGWKGPLPAESSQQLTTFQPTPFHSTDPAGANPAISLLSGKDEAKRLLRAALGTLQTVKVETVGEKFQQEFDSDADAKRTAAPYFFQDSDSGLASGSEASASAASSAMPQPSVTRYLDPNNFMTDDLWEDDGAGACGEPLPPPRQFMYEGRQFPLAMPQQPLGSIPEGDVSKPVAEEVPEMTRIPEDEESPQLYVKKTFIEVAGETSGGPGIAAMTALFRSEPQMSRSHEWRAEEKAAPWKVEENPDPRPEQIPQQEPATVTPQESLGSAQARRLVLQAVKRKKPMAKAPTETIFEPPQETDELDVFPRSEPVENNLVSSVFQVQQEIPSQRSGALDHFCPIDDEFANPTSPDDLAGQSADMGKPMEIALSSETRLPSGRFFTSTGSAARVEKVGAKEQSMRLLKSLGGRRVASKDEAHQSQEDEDQLRLDELVYILPSSRDGSSSQVTTIENSDIPTRLRAEAFWSV